MWTYTTLFNSPVSTSDISFYAKNYFCILLVANAHIHIRHQFHHNILRFFETPEFCTIILIAGNRCAFLSYFLTRLKKYFCKLIRQSRTNSTPMEPISTIKIESQSNSSFLAKHVAEYDLS